MAKLGIFFLFLTASIASTVCKEQQELSVMLDLPQGSSRIIES